MTDKERIEFLEKKVEILFNMSTCYAHFDWESGRRWNNLALSFKELNKEIADKELDVYG